MTSASRFAATLGRLLFESGSAQTMAGFRIAFAAALLVSQLALLPDLGFFFADSGMLPNAALSAHQPDLYWSVLHLVDSVLAVHLVHAAYLVALVLLLVGYRTHIAAVAVFVLAVSFRHRNLFIANSGDQLAALVAFWMMFADSGAAWSVDARSGHGPWTRSWVLVHLRLQLCFVYGCSVLQKLTDPDWVNGEKMFYTAALVEDWTIPLTSLMDHPVLFKGITWGSMVFELLFPLLVWNRRTRPWMLASAVLFHLGIAVLLGLPFFGLVMMALLTAFLSWGDRRSPHS